MRLKKLNAYITILALLLLLAHSIYQAVAFLIYYHNSAITAMLGHALSTVMAVHGLLGLYFVCIRHDSKTIKYKKLNLRTYLQRISMIVILIFLFPHMATFALLEKLGNTPFIHVINVMIVIFYAAIWTHVALSFSKALITLGFITDEKQKKTVDIIMAVICSVVFLATSIIIPMTYLIMFGG